MQHIYYQIFKKRAEHLRDFEKWEIKNYVVRSDELDKMKSLKRSYETLFSRRSQQYKLLGLSSLTMTEKDYSTLILSHYSFLKRPVFNINDQFFFGSDKKEKEALDRVLNKL